MEVTVSLRNPPIGADEWQLRICNASKTETRFIGDIPIAGVANFTDIPPDWDLPLCIDLTVYQYINGQRQLYRIQSIEPYLWDWDIGDWGDIPDPTYKPVFIPSFGSFYFNFSTQRFEGIEERAGCLPVVMGLVVAVLAIALGIGVAIIGGI